MNIVTTLSAFKCIRRNWFRIVLLGVAMVALFGWLAAPQRPADPRAQAALLGAASAHPEGTFSVIVRKAAEGTGVETRVLGLGGTITNDLWIIDAFAAELPGRAVAELARSDGVRWISMDAPMVKSGSPCRDCIDISNLKTAYARSIGADRLWNGPDHLLGQGVMVAVVDSGVNFDLKDLGNQRGSRDRVLVSVNYNSFSPDSIDKYGHGTHVAGIIGGDGERSRGEYIGVAPSVNLVSVKVSGDFGAGKTSDVVKGLQWILQHKSKYNIRVVNVSLNSSTPESYLTSPLDAALEVLWFNRITVVVSAGNSGTRGINYPPANDPFVITVGATDDRGTPGIGDDTIAAFSAFGNTDIGNFAKPDLVAPGTNIISLLASNNSVLARAHPDHLVNRNYFRMSGTSMSSAVGAGAVALLLQHEANLTPDQVKYRLKVTANKSWPGYDQTKAGAGYLDIYAAVHGTSLGSANTGLKPSGLFKDGVFTTWGSVNWDSVNWDSVNWDSVNWDSVNWDSVNWDSDYWGK